MRRYAKFITEDGETVLLQNDIEIPNHITGEILPAGYHTPEEAVILQPGLVNAHRFAQPKLALRCEKNYRAHRLDS